MHVAVLYGNRARGVLPIHARFTFSDGSTQDFDYPAEVWSTNTTHYVRRLRVQGKKLTKIELDPDKRLLDIDRANNVWPREADGDASQSPKPRMLALALLREDGPAAGRGAAVARDSGASPRACGAPRARTRSRTPAPRPARCRGSSRSRSGRRRSTASQFGSHEWLMNRASLPSTAASITTSSSIANRKVWCRSAIDVGVARVGLGRRETLAGVFDQAGAGRNVRASRTRRAPESATRESRTDDRLSDSAATRRVAAARPASTPPEMMNAITAAASASIR